MREEKTWDEQSGQRLISGINCDGLNSILEFEATNQNIFNKIQSDIHSTAYSRCHNYIADEVVVDGMTYRVISAVPFSDGDYHPETVQEKLKYLINGKKS